jgi:hypothetical protein
MRYLSTVILVIKITNQLEPPQMSYLCRIFLVLAVGLALPVTKSFAEAPVSICGESWPPYLYETGGDQHKKKKVAGIHLKNFR